MNLNEKDRKPVKLLKKKKTFCSKVLKNLKKVENKQKINKKNVLVIVMGEGLDFLMKQIKKRKKMKEMQK